VSKENGSICRVNRTFSVNRVARLSVLVSVGYRWYNTRVISNAEAHLHPKAAFSVKKELAVLPS